MVDRPDSRSAHASAAHWLAWGSAVARHLASESGSVRVDDRDRGRLPALEAGRYEVVVRRTVEWPGDDAAMLKRYSDRQGSRRSAAPVRPVDDQACRIEFAWSQQHRAERRVRVPYRPDRQRLPVGLEDRYPGQAPQDARAGPAVGELDIAAGLCVHALPSRLDAEHCAGTTNDGWYSRAGRPARLTRGLTPTAHPRRLPPPPRPPHLRAY